MMTKMRLLVAIPLAMFAAGCGTGPSLVSVSGTVTMNGKPLEGAIVQFLPEADNKAGLPAEDVTGPSGNYKAMTKGRSGVVPGKYKVVVSKTPPASGAIAGQFPDDPYMAQLSATPVGNPKAAKKDAGPTKLEKSFDREITAGGGTVDFDVKATADEEKSASKGS